MYPEFSGRHAHCLFAFGFATRRSQHAHSFVEFLRSEIAGNLISIGFLRLYEALPGNRWRGEEERLRHFERLRYDAGHASAHTSSQGVVVDREARARLVIAVKLCHFGE